ncbi:response regulator receiver modulated diguanylate cyclase [Alkalidesulfovibrio alkalitolerans DSM 16529]|uniref:Response regulator receiver modulated diguanylate cyclase n=1 Tax=Alkalidesulfovibrio alkalitolerans DSM 16529 TaxID=1121439 RepID=S7TFW8_9BACT|nr:diguanylate cyclase [Alkalidesulfovibrio alkalitolerans]EPR36117.1 response regulator receiver modulated diguanylate cyclase [Alkalidesulfovibrio alkalitolerans DSM 16529]
MAESETTAHAPLLVVAGEDTRRELADALTRAGREVVGLSSADEAVAAAAKKAFAAAFVAVRHLGGSGFEVAERLRAIAPAIGLAFVSGEEYADDVVQAMRFGACEFVRLPLREAEVSLALARLAERAELEDFAFQARLRYDHLVQNIPLIIFSLASDLRLSFINRACIDILGYSPEEAATENGFLAERLHPQDRESVLSHLRAALAHSTPFTEQARLVHRHGHTVHVIIKSMPRFTFTAQGPEPELSGVIMDISERVVLERALIQDEKLKMLGSISAEVAHEIRNPLVAIGGFARRLKTAHPDLDDVDIILRETARLENLLARIRDYLKPLRMTPRPCSLDEIIEECLVLLASEFSAVGAQTRFIPTPDLPMVTADPDVLGQVVVTLLLHALRHLPRGGALNLASERDGANVRMTLQSPTSSTVLDSPERSLLPFDTETEHLGLPLCYRLIKGMGGLLSYTREADVARYAISLPVEAGAASGVVYDLADSRRWPDEHPAGVPHDSEFEAALAREWKRGGRHHTPLCMLMIDVDDYTDFVARHGADVAQEALSRVARVLEDMLKRPGDFVDTGGGQQFTAVLPDTDELGGMIVAEDIRENVAALAIPHRDGSGAGVLTVCVGVASLVPTPETEPTHLIEEATRALYAAKAQGGNKVHAARLSKRR